MRETDLAYLAGIVDGEGCISIVRSRSEYAKVDGSRSLRYRMRVTIVSTTPKIIIACSETMNEIGVKHNVNSAAPDAPRKTRFNLCVSSISSAVSLLKAIYPYLKEKQNQADLIFKLSEMPVYPTKIGRGKNGIEVESLCKKLSSLKRVNAPVETVCHAPNSLGREMGKIQSDLHGDMQRQAEMPCPVAA